MKEGEWSDGADGVMENDQIEDWIARKKIKGCQINGWT